MFAALRLEWVVPVIAVILYAIGAIMKAREEAEAKANPRPVEPRGNTELDRFLQEIERLRRERAGMSTKELEEQRLDEYENEEEQEEAYRPQPARPVIIQTPTLVVREPEPVIRRIEPAKVIPPIVPLRIADRPNIAPTTWSRSRSPSVVAVTSMLRNRQTIASAIILQEILGPPKCRG